jgi:RimJ/RimL family protein N-acetyltransferase
VANAARGRGVGKALLRALVEEPEVHGIWTLQAGIFPENAASIALHKSCGFRKLACGGGSASWEMFGETYFCWSAAVRGLVSRRLWYETATTERWCCKQST